MVDQSAFAESQAVLQAPPIDPEEQKAARKRNLIFAGIGGFIVLMILLGIAGSRRPEVVVQPTPLPSPTPLPMTNAMQQELEKVEAVVNQNNPDDIIVSPPQVDMQVEF